MNVLEQQVWKLNSHEQMSQANVMSGVRATLDWGSFMIGREMKGVDVTGRALWASVGGSGTTD